MCRPSEMKERIWKQFCKLDSLSQYKVVYDYDLMYDDFQCRLEDEDDIEVLCSLEEEISDYMDDMKKKKKKR